MVLGKVGWRCGAGLVSAALLTSGRNSVAVFKAQIGVYRNVALIIALFHNTR